MPLVMKTTRFGKIAYNTSQVLRLEQGLIGFNELKNYVMIKRVDKYQWLQSLDDGAIAFYIANPCELFPSYDIGEITKELLSVLDVADNGTRSLAVIISVNSANFEQSTVNLKAPLVFNKHTRKGTQIIVRDTKYYTRHKISDLEKGVLKV